MTTLEKMLKVCDKAGFQPTENVEKIARAKVIMFNETEWYRCPCDANNEQRSCISELCADDIKRDGICHCRCYKK